MTIDDTKKMLAMMEIAYPKFYADATIDKKRMALELWHSMFGQYPAEICVYAFKRLIEELKFPPTPADLKKRIDTVMDMEDDSIDDLWRLVHKAVVGQIKYKQLPKTLRKYFTGQAEIDDIGMCDVDHFQTVIKSNFYRRVPQIMQALKEEEMIDPMVRKLAQNMKLGLKEPQRMIGGEK